MPRQRVKISEILPPSWVAVHTSASGRKGATRWQIYSGEDIYRGDLVRWMPEGTWSWQPNSTDVSNMVVDGTINDCSAAIFKLAEELGA